MLIMDDIIPGLLGATQQHCSGSDADVKSQPREEKRYFKIKIPHTNFPFVFVFVIVILFVFVFVICICLYLSFWRKTVH